MRAVHTVKEIRESLESARTLGRVIGLIPTMGALHKGHTKLIEIARKECKLIVVSIFVNPLQFGPTEDYTKYPRPLANDLELCDRNGVDLVFAPSTEEMYPSLQVTFMEVSGVSEHLCGAFRPGHFRGVATVVLKLFNIVQPGRAYFGEKDLQQLAVIRRMTRDLNLPIVIVGMPTVRESDGLAVSSRNQYLSVEERKVAPVLFRALQAAKAMAGGEKDPAKVREAAVQVLNETPEITIEYVEIVDPDEIKLVRTVGPGARIAAAVWLGPTRLIDNVSLGD